jgi:hypothetical protein
MIEHHFIIKYSKEGGWSKDKGEAEYLDDDDLIGEQLGALLEIANGAKTII